MPRGARYIGARIYLVSEPGMKDGHGSIKVKKEARSESKA
jgi:hypothetical protein